MDATKLQKDHSFATPQDAKELKKDYSFATLQGVKELQKDYPFFTPQYVAELLETCPNVSLQDVANHTVSSGPSLIRYFPLRDIHDMINSSIRHINHIRENEKLNGREHVEAGPLLHVHSVRVQPKKALKKQQLAVYGTIKVIYQNIKSGNQMELDVYNRSAKDADRISSSGGNLTLGWPIHLFRSEDLWMKLQGTLIVVDLYLKVGGKVVPFAKDDILVGDTTEGDFEELISKEFHSNVCCATLTYIAMPFASLCRVEVRLSGIDEGRVVNVAGNIVARYKNTYGNYKSEPCVLFETQKGFEPVVMNEQLTLSRAWLGLPAYSSLELDLNLRDFDTKRKIGHRLELLNGNDMHVILYAVSANRISFAVEAGLFSCPLEGHIGWSNSNKYKAIRHPKFRFESPSFNNGNTWFHDQGKTSITLPSGYAEFYSIFIGCRNMAALKISGTVEFFTSCSGNHYIFKSNGNDGVEVEDSQKILPLKDGCISFDSYATLKLKVNLQDVGGKFANRGFATYRFGTGPPHSYFNTQICSVFPGKDGFCALHYSLFPRACKANIEIIFNSKSFHSRFERIYGSAIVYYNNFDYSTKFKRDYYRSMLFRRTEKDPVQIMNDGKVPLSRNAVAVPMDSSLIIEVDFCVEFLKDNLFCKEMFPIGRCYFKTEINDYELEIKLTWGDGLNNGWSELDKDKGCTMGGENQMKTSIKRTLPDQCNGESDLDEDELMQDCKMGGVNQANTSAKREQPDQHNASSKSSAMDVVITDEEDEELE